MFDFTQRGTIAEHSYRGFYDAKGQDGTSTTHCAFCNRRIRFCYAIHDVHERTFVIGTCDFYRYKGTPVYRELKAARVLQRSYLHQRLRDQRIYGTVAEVKEARKLWAKARRRAFFRINKFKTDNGAWLPKPWFDLQSAAKLVPHEYKRKTLALRWYRKQVAKIEELIQQASI